MNHKSTNAATQPDERIGTEMRAQIGALCREIINIESEGVAALEKTLPQNLYAALSLLNLREGNIIVIGIGKSGHVGRKIAATLSSTGSPAFFLHATEACHGDSGVITQRDTILAISQSGESDEFSTLLPLIRELGVPVIAITAKPASTLARNSKVVIDNAVRREACPHNLAPTTSTTTALVIGDVLAMCLLKLNGFTANDFARSHPAGMLGRRLLLRIRDAMVAGDKIPRVLPNTVLSDAILEMSNKGLGMTAVADEHGKILGVFTDGDLRRSLQNKVDIHCATIDKLMTRSFHTIDADAPATEGIHIMEKEKISSLLVPDSRDSLIGVVTIHTLVQLRLV